MLLDEVGVVLARGDVESCGRRDATLVHGILVGVPERHEFVVGLEVGELEARNPPHRLERGVARPREFFRERRELPARGHAVKPADAHVHGMDLPAAEQRDDRVAGLLQPQPALHRLALIARHCDRVGVAEEVRCVQHVDVQRVALDPLAAVDESPERPKLPVHAYVERVFHRVHRAHLVRDRADAADAGRDVGCLREATPAQERFEEAWRLEDLEPHLLDAAVSAP